MQFFVGIKGKGVFHQDFDAAAGPQDVRVGFIADHEQMQFVGVIRTTRVGSVARYAAVAERNQVDGCVN